MVRNDRLHLSTCTGCSKVKKDQHLAQVMGGIRGSFEPQKGTGAVKLQPSDHPNDDKSLAANHDIKSSKKILKSNIYFKFD